MKLFLFLCLFPMLSFSQGIMDLEERVTALEAIPVTTKWRLVDANDVQIGEVFLGELTPSGAVLDIAIVLSGTNDGRFALVRIRKEGLLFFGDGGVNYPSDDCTGDPIVINGVLTGLINRQISRIAVDGKIMIIDPDMPIVIDQMTQSLATVSSADVIECIAIAPSQVDGNAGIVIFDPVVNPGLYKLVNN